MEALKADRNYLQRTIAEIEERMVKQAEEASVTEGGLKARISDLEEQCARMQDTLQVRLGLTSRRTDLTHPLNPESTRFDQLTHRFDTSLNQPQS